MKYMCVSIGLLASAMLATAQSQFTYVSGTGSNSGGCLRPNPCRDFFYAIGQTNAGGTVKVVDAGDFAGFEITKSLTIDGSGFASLTSPISFKLTGSEQVVIRNLNVYPGLGNSNLYVDGILGFINGTVTVTIEDVNVVSPAGPYNNGISMITTIGAPGTPRVFLRNVTCTGGTTGFLAAHAGGGGPGPSITADRFSAANNSQYGMWIKDSSLVARDSTLHGNAIAGLSVQSQGAPTSALIERSEFSFNGIGVSASNATVRLADSVVTGNAVGLDNGGTIVSFRTNMIAGNTTDGTPALSTSLK